MRPSRRRALAIAVGGIALLAVPPWLPQFYLLLTTEIAIMGLFAIGFNVLLGYAGMVSFGHAAFFGFGAYACGLLLKKADAPFVLSFLAAPVAAAVFGLVIGVFCVRLTRIYFSMLTLAFSQIVWATAHKWYSLTGGDNGLIGLPLPAWLGTAIRLHLFAVGVCLMMTGVLWRVVNAPFGRMLLAIRENRERAASIGINVRRVQLIAFAISGGVSGLAGALFALFSGGAFPDYAVWTKSAEVLLMTLLGGQYVFLGPALGAALLIGLNSFVTSYTEYWPLILGSILLALLYIFPGGVTRILAGRGRHAADVKSVASA